MRITIPRFLIALGVAVLAQAGVFAWYNGDLLYLRRPVSAIVADDAAVFAQHAGGALARPDLTRQHLDTIATAAKQLGRSTQEIQALERRLIKDPSDKQIKLRLADALRRRGDFGRAETLYREVLATTAVTNRRP